MDTVDLTVRQLAFLRDEMFHVENNQGRHSSERKMAENIREQSDDLLEMECDEVVRSR
ncbi:hypothetical protein [Halonotius sp. GCM10025705]|uniref:hypothetical protein n=1 Tax=Halonotius sp. GCM10025705 TaxID=3252678 RepID=UPI0036099923